MNLHSRYLQQAAWTRDLREYLFKKAGISKAVRILEVGCGTGAILREMETTAALHGLDIDPAALNECRIHAPRVSLTRGDGHFLPFRDHSFDLVFCHFLLLWVRDPHQVVSELARIGQTVIALAEPDYSQRIDKPIQLKPLGEWQTESLRRQGANPSFGSQLADAFYRAGIRIIETGPIQGHEVLRTAGEWQAEWKVLESDLKGVAPEGEIQKMRLLDEQAWSEGKRILNVPTYFAWGKTWG